MRMAALEQVLAVVADRLVDGPETVLIIDDTALPKLGTHAVGVARQYCGTLGKRANCQVLVSLTLAQAEVPVPLALRLSLPEGWASDPARRARQQVSPADVALTPPTKGPTGRPQTHPVPAAPSGSAEAMVEALGPRAFRWRSWRTGTNGPLVAEFAAWRAAPGWGCTTTRS